MCIVVILQVATPLFAKKDSNKESDVIEVRGSSMQALASSSDLTDLTWLWHRWTAS